MKRGGIFIAAHRRAKAASRALAALGALGLLASFGASLAEARDSNGRVLVADVSGAIDTGSGDYLEGAIKKAEEGGYELLVIKLDTPGGMLDTTREIVEAELGAHVPVAVYVTPSGARAGSAGVFITLAANIAAMAPSSNIGAAHPVGIGSTSEKEDKSDKDAAKDDATIMFHKVENDTVALMEAIAQKRSRNHDWAVSSVKESASITAEKALELKVIDLIADDLPDLLKKLDGRVVQVVGGARTLHTATATIEPLGWSAKQQTLHWFANPEIAGLFMTLGIVGILAEFYHPGAVYPGVIGGIALLFAAVGLHMLPVNLGGVLFLVAAVGFFVAELYVTGYGMLAVAGAVCLVIGSLLLIDNVSFNFYADPDFGISKSFIIPIAASIALGAILLAYKVVGAWKKKPVAGEAGLIGEAGVVREAILAGAAGKVFVHGELWEARADVEFAQGARVVVTHVEGLKLRVSLAPGQSVAAPAAAPA